MKKLLILLWFIPALLIGQTTYYIDEAGDNDDGGGVGDPWLTLTYACTQVAPPDIIHVNAGTYIENTVCALAAGVSIEGDGATSIITTTNATANYTIINLTSVEGTDGSQSISDLKIDGGALKATWGIWVQGRSNVVLHDITFTDFIRSAIRMQATDNTGAEPTNYAAGNEVYSCTITNCSRMVTGTGTGCLEIGGQEGIDIDDNVITQTARAAGSNGFPIKYCDGGFNKDFKIHDNTLTKATYNGSGDWDFSIELWDCRGGVEIYDNILSAGVDIGGYITEKGTYSYAVYIHNNTIGPAALSTEDGTRGIVIEGEWKGYIDIRYNHIKNVARGISIQSSYAGKTMTDLNIDYNIIENIGLANGGADYKGWGIDWMEPLVSTDQTVNNINIRNNVITSAETDASTMWGIAVPGVGEATNIRIQNNIVMNFAYAPVYGTDWDDGSVTLDYLYIENNVFHGNGNSNLPRYGGSPLAPTHNTTQNNLIVDPEFVGGGDYSLQATSDAIDAGLDVGLTRDYLGKVVGSSPDIGAYEYGAEFPHVPIFFGGKPVFSNGKIVFR